MCKNKQMLHRRRWEKNYVFAQFNGRYELNNTCAKTYFDKRKWELCGYDDVLCMYIVQRITGEISVTEGNDTFARETKSNNFGIKQLGAISRCALSKKFRIS